MLRWSGSFFWVAVIFALAAGVVNFAPAPDLGRSELGMCPTSIVGLRGQDLPIEEFVLEELAPTDMISRAYVGTHPEETVFLVLAYFENARYGAHDPEVCYRSQGWRTEPLPPSTLVRGSRTPVEAQLFSVKRRTHERLVMYWWYINEDVAMGDHRKFLDSMALQGILRGSNYGSFVRVSTPMWPDEETASARLNAFAQQLMDALPSLFDEEAG